MMQPLANPFERKQIKTFQKRLEELAAQHGYGKNALSLDEIIAKVYPERIKEPDFPDWEIYYSPLGKESDSRFFAYYRRKKKIITAVAGDKEYKDVLEWLNKTEETTVQAKKGRNTFKIIEIAGFAAYVVVSYSLSHLRPYLKWTIPLTATWFTSLYFLYCQLSGNLKRITVPDSLVNNHVSIGTDALNALQDLYKIKN